MKPLLVLHTTEGSSAASAVETMMEGNKPSHLVLDPATRERRQLLPWNSTAASLRNLRGDEDLGVETNRRGKVYQVEIVGFVDPARASHPRHIDNWSDAEWDWLAEEIRAICRELEVPIEFPYDFGTYPDTYGGDTMWRMSPAEWEQAFGIVGHLHVPENLHGDPSHIRPLIDRLAPGRLDRPRLPKGSSAVPPPPSAPIGDPEVVAFQRLLAEDPVEYTGRIDGDFGPKSLAAARADRAARRALELRVKELEDTNVQASAALVRQRVEMTELQNRLTERGVQVQSLTAEVQRISAGAEQPWTTAQIKLAAERATWIGTFLTSILELDEHPE